MIKPPKFGDLMTPGIQFLSKNSNPEQYLMEKLGFRGTRSLNRRKQENFYRHSSRFRYKTTVSLQNNGSATKRRYRYRNQYHQCVAQGVQVFFY